VNVNNLEFLVLGLTQLHTAEALLNNPSSLNVKAPAGMLTGPEQCAVYLIQTGADVSLAPNQNRIN
jgi:hypothetical protein